MDRHDPLQTLPLEERIRQARAERSVAIGEDIGGALEALWRVLTDLPFAASRPRPRAITPE